MEYKIGQRVKCRGKEGYLIHYCVDDDYWHIDINGQVENCYDTTELSPLYKPGDQVRVKSREELIAINGEDVMYYVSVLADKILTLDFQIEEYEKPTWATLEMPRWEVEEIDFEWHSGVEDKPDDALIGVKRVGIDYDKINGLYKKGEHVPVHVLEAQNPGLQDQATFGCDCIVTVKNGKTYVEPLNPLTSGECMACITAEGGKTEWSGAPTVWNDQLESKHIAQIKKQLILKALERPVDFLPVEVHQDKDRNRAALAEVLKIKEPTTNKWMCPKCRFAGSIPDVRQHCVVAHGESLPPPESKSYWETWRVS